MSTKTNAMITLNYEDNSTRNVTFKDIDVSEMQYMADRVKAINNNMSANFRGTFISDNGAAVTSIGKAQVIRTTEEVIYSE